MKKTKWFLIGYVILLLVCNVFLFIVIDKQHEEIITFEGRNYYEACALDIAQEAVDNGVVYLTAPTTQGNLVVLDLRLVNITNVR